MEKDGGIYKIQCKVNGAPMKMFFDTGATSVSISLSTAMYLFDNDLITKADIRGMSKTQTADGAIKDNMIVNLKDVEIAGLHLKDIQAVVSSSLNAPLLLGQSAIQKLGKITLQGNLLTIHNNTSQAIANQNGAKWDAELRKLRNERTTNADSQYEILEIIERIEKSGGSLNEFELFCKTMALSNVYKFDEALSASSEWIDRFSLNTDSIDWKMRVYIVSAKANIYSENGDDEKGMEHLKRCWNYWLSNEDNIYFWAQVPLLYGKYEEKKNQGFSQTIIVTKQSIKYLLKKSNITLNEINNNNASDDSLIPLFYTLAFAYSHDIEYKNRYTDQNIKIIEISSILAAKVGVEEAKEFCRAYNLDYKRLLSRYEIGLIGLDD